jgi:hypothetical protein
MKESKILKQQEKQKSYKIKTVTYLSGTTKTKFLNDCLLREETECNVLRNIVDIHYSIINLHPELKDKEFKEIKTALTKNK